MEETHKGTVKRDLNVRSGPPMNGVLAPLTGKVLHAGDVVYGQLDKVTDWFNFGRVTRIDGSAGAFAGWASAVDWDTANPPYIAVTAIAPPPPPDTLDINVDVVVNVEGYLPKTISISGSLEKA